MSRKGKPTAPARRSAAQKPAATSKSDLTHRSARHQYRGPSIAEKIEQSFQKGKSISLDHFRTLIKRSYRGITPPPLPGRATTTPSSPPHSPRKRRRLR